MKKLLSAVTSVLMASSFVTSAFASSFNVSAAGGVSAVQPNVSMEDVVDGAANKYAVQSDFIVKGSELKYNPNGDNYMDFFTESNGHKGNMIVFEIGDLPAGVTAEVDPVSKAFSNKPKWSVLGETWSLTCFDPASGDTQLFDDNNYVVSFKITADSSVKDGTYEIGFSRFHVVEQANQLVGDIVEFDATVVPGKLIIGEGGPVTTAPTTKPTSGGNNNSQSDFIVKGSTLEYKAGENNYMDFYTESNGHKGNMIVFEIGDLPAGVTAEVDPVSKAFSNKPKWSVMGETWSLTCFDPASGDTQLFDDSNYVVSFKITAADSVADGTYEIGFKRFHVVEQANQLVGDIVEFDATVVPGKLIIGDGGSTDKPTTTPTTKPTQGGPTQADFIVKGSTVEYKAGEANYMDFYTESNGHKGNMVVFEISDLPAGVTAEVDPVSKAFSNKPKWSVMGETWSLTCFDPASGDTQLFDDSNYVVSFKITADSSVATGTYEIGFKRFHVVEQANQMVGDIVEFDATVIPGILIINGGAEPTTKPSEGGSTQADFIVKGSTVEYKAGEANYMDFYTESNGHKGNMVVFEISDLPAGVTAEVDPVSKAFSNKPKWSVMGETWSLTCFDPASGDTQLFDDSNYVVSFKITADDSVKDGTYEIGFKRFHVVEQANQMVGDIVEFDATVIPGKLIIGNIVEGDGPADSDNTTPDDFVIKGATLELTKGSDYSNAYIDFTVEPGSHKASILSCEIDTLPAGIEGSVTDRFCYAINGKPAWEAIGSTYQCYCVDPATHSPQSFTDGGVVISVALSIPADIAAGEYEIDLKNFHVVEQASQAAGTIVEFDSKVVPGKLIIKDADTPVASGEASWVIGTVIGTPGEEVTVPVYVDGASTLEVAGATFEIAANGATFSKVNANSAAYGNAPITNNAATNEFAFAQADGKGSAAADQAVIMNLTYKVPADATGTIPVEWANVVVSDTNGNLITSKVKVTNGAIVISDEPVADGTASWVIGTVNGTPGEEVTVPVYVDGASTLEVAGATFKITANGADFSKVDANSAAYGNAPITNNAATDEFAFAQADGKGSAAADQAVIMNLTYKVPADAKGTIPVEWADVTVSDTNGNLITSKVKVTNGAIVIKKGDEGVVADEVTWVIGTVEGTPGTTVDVPVYVKGSGNVEVAGATFEITAKDDGFVTLSNVSGNSAAYGNAPIVNNKETNEFAFAQADGKGSAAADEAVIMVLSYDIPEPEEGLIIGGRIPIEWSNVTVSDTNGNIITDEIKLENGAIVFGNGDIGSPADEATWVIDTVEGTPGQTVEVTVYVDGDSELEVAGATFTINSEAGFNKVSGNSAAYGNAPITNNAETSEFAFAQADGKGSAAADKAVIMVLTYDVPADATEDIPVTWANVTVSDTNGKLITDDVNLVNGKIVIKPVTTTETPVTTTEAPVTSTTAAPVTSTTASSTETPATTTTTAAPAEDVVEWVITTVKGNPGETVNLNVYVNGTNTVAVAGATYTINAEGVEFAGVNENSAAYGNAPITNNKDTNEFAWAQADGKDSVAADQAVIMVISYKIPENATGTIPVTWADVTVSDTNGNLITDKVKLVDGAIIIDEETSSTSTTTTTAAPTTEAPGTTTTAAPTTEAPGTTTAAPTTAAPGTTTTAAPTTEAPGTTTTAAPTTEAPGTTTTAAPGTSTTEAPGTSTTEAPGTSTTEAPGTSTTEAPVTTTATSTVPQGAIVWAGETVTAAPGQEVTLSFVVNDPNGVKLEVGGAQFTVDADGNVKLVGGTGSEAYGADFQENLDTLEYAFANAKGSATVAPDGSKVITLTLQVPEDAKAGDVFNIGLSNLNVSDANGNDITDKVIVLDGKIIVVPPVTTTTTTVTTGSGTETTITVTTVTGSDVVTTTTGSDVVTTTTGSDEVTTTTGSDEVTTTTGSDVVTTTTGSDVVTTTTGSDVVTTTTGSDVVTTTTVSDVVTTTTGSDVVTTTTGSDVVTTTTGSDVVTTTTGSDVVTTTTTATVTTGSDQPSTPPTETSTTATVSTGSDETTTTTATESTGSDEGSTTTTASGTVSPGDDTTTTTTRGAVISGDSTVTVAVRDGYFFSHDPRSFPADMVIAKYVQINGEVADFDPSKVTFEDTVNGGGSPMAAYRLSQTDFTYKLNVFYDGEPVYLEDGTRAVVTAFIGVKGDSNLDNKVDSMDATNVLAYYADIMTGGDVNTSTINPEYDKNTISAQERYLDTLGKFLADVDLDCYSKDNWNLGCNREISSGDASSILAFYANVMTNRDLPAYDNWIMTLGENYKESFEDYRDNGTIK